MAPLPPIPALRALETGLRVRGALELSGDRVDDTAMAAITELYREVMPAGGAILDVISTGFAHLPPEIPYRRVVGLGNDAGTLAENPFLDEWRVQDLNGNPLLPYATGE